MIIKIEKGKNTVVNKIIVAQKIGLSEALCFSKKLFSLSSFDVHL
ncbi:hypothetical protein HMPREF9418_2238 [Neisseria macacae ATCC 33926]|uniref:Uncharacterized protein n=1 Tax=Neisseria macacae ATCC 33926 TaxID=997348 RepID=A0AA36XJN9_9NEIS|nr:hypothetical protein HMPREF9418_2238 [Neisseria macacae ATCC 33926]